MNLGLLAALISGAASSQSRGAVPAALDVTPTLNQIERGLVTTEGQLSLVEKGFVERMQSGDQESLEARFSKGELQFLLQDYVAASVLLFDVVLSPSFKSSRHYLDGVYYLGESLYQQKDYLGAKRFLRESIEAGPTGIHFRDALSRYLDIAARTSDFRDLDHYIELTHRSGRLAPEVQYLLGKATFDRTDLPKADRLQRAIQEFSQVSPDSPFYLQAVYFQGVCEVERGQLTAAIELFRQVENAPASKSGPAKGPVTRQMHDLAALAIGRLDYELGRYSEALDTYQDLPVSSPYFYDALYEVAWTYVKKGDYENARKAAELLMLGAPEGTLLPEANLLRGQLLLKLRRYDESQETFNAVIQKYGRVRDQIDGLLKVNGDPAAYFDKLLAQKGRDFDVTSLLPPAARSWAISQREVAEAQQVTTDLRDGRQVIGEAEEIVRRLNERMAGAEDLSVFPALQAGYSRAAAVDAALLAADDRLVEVEKEILSPYLSPTELNELHEIQTKRQTLARRFASLPQTPQAAAARQQGRVERIKEVEQNIFRLSMVVQSERAQLVAVQRMADQTRAQRKVVEADETFAKTIQEELHDLAETDAQIGDLLRNLKEEEQTASGVTTAPESKLRAEYAEALAREGNLLLAARNHAEGQTLADAQRIAALRERVAQLRNRTAASLETFRQAAITQAQIIREKVALEDQNLADYGQEVVTDEAKAGGLVGRIAYESFRKVYRTVYNLVLKADVGIIDVAWTRKQASTGKIQKLASDEDRELRLLDGDFKEVLGEVR